MSQFLFDRLGRCLKLFVSTESISCHEFASQFSLAIFYMRNTPKNSLKPCRPPECLFERTIDRPLIASYPSKRGVNCVTVGCQWPIEQRRRCVRAHACVRACDVFAIYDNNIWPRLIMIIIKIIILYFIQITHTDDFPSTSAWLVY